MGKNEKKATEAWDYFEPVFEGYDPDSSPFVWKYVYSKIYFEKEKDLKFWRNKVGLIETDKIQNFLRTKGNRIIACMREGYPDFGGETDFNFSESKYEYFKKRINSSDTVDKEILCKELEKCRKMHHALENFSLMPRTGGLQLVKGRRYDRLDCFISELDKYFKADKSKPFEHEIFSGISVKYENNRRILKRYLDAFVDESEENGREKAIYKYCSTIYKMDETWVNDMLKISEEKDEISKIKEYMRLAIKYWDKKWEEHFNIYIAAYEKALERVNKAGDEIRNMIDERSLR